MIAVSLILSFLILFSAIIITLNDSRFVSLFFVHASPDSQGNDIQFNEIWTRPNETTGYDLIANITTNTTVSIHDNYYVLLNCTVRFNCTLGDGLTNTRVNITITYNNAVNYIANNVSMVQWGTETTNTTYWWVPYYYNWTSTLPTAGVLYNCTEDYQPYY